MYIKDVVLHNPRCLPIPPWVSSSNVNSPTGACSTSIPPFSCTALFVEARFFGSVSGLGKSEFGVCRDV